MSGTHCCFRGSCMQSLMSCSHVWGTVFQRAFLQLYKKPRPPRCMLHRAGKPIPAWHCWEETVSTCTGCRHARHLQDCACHASCQREQTWLVSGRTMSSYWAVQAPAPAAAKLPLRSSVPCSSCNNCSWQRPWRYRDLE